MRKSVVGAEVAAVDGAGSRTSGSGVGSPAYAAGEWMDLEQVARVEVSSEDDLFPVEHALGQRVSMGWRAGEAGPQVIRLLFDEAVTVRRILVHVVERAAERSQEFAIYVGTAEAGASGATMRQVVRQQFTFSPGGSTEEIEEYAVELEGVRLMELRIDPDRVNETAGSVNYASLMALRVG